MKALDTPVLLSLLAGERPARDLLRRLRGDEVATTEANLLELSVLAGSAPARSIAARREAVGRLRRRMTVLPIDPRAVEEIARRVGRGGLSRLPPLVLAMLGSLEANGCDELITDALAIPGRWRFRVTRHRCGMSK